MPGVGAVDVHVENGIVPFRALNIFQLMIKYGYLLIILFACTSASGGVLTKVEINTFIDLTTRTHNHAVTKSLDKWEQLMGVQVSGVWM